MWLVLCPGELGKPIKILNNNNMIFINDTRTGNFNERIWYIIFTCNYQWLGYVRL